MNITARDWEGRIFEDLDKRLSVLERKVDKLSPGASAPKRKKPKPKPKPKA